MVSVPVMIGGPRPSGRGKQPSLRQRRHRAQARSWLRSAEAAAVTTELCVCILGLGERRYEEPASQGMEWAQGRTAARSVQAGDGV